MAGEPRGERDLQQSLAGTCVVIPAHNEAGVIGEVLDDFAALPCRVVVVDDGSTDATYAVCLDHAVHLLRHGINLGQGAALQTGITYALSLPDVRFIVTFDSDGQHDIAAVEALVRPLSGGDFDVALGTRFARSSDVAAIPRARRMLLRCAVWFTRVTTGLAVTDTHNGLRAFTADAARRLHIRHAGMAHASEILATVRSEKLRWHEVPVSIEYTDYSRSKGQRGGAAMDIVWDLVTGRFR